MGDSFAEGANAENPPRRYTELVMDEELITEQREMSEIIFNVEEDAVDGGYSASALGFGIHTEAETVDELRENVREAVDAYFDENMEAPAIIRLQSEANA